MPTSHETRPPVIECARRHRHASPEQAAECDHRRALREQSQREKAAKRESPDQGLLSPLFSAFSSTPKPDVT
jgi:hypothetical protein